MARRMTHDEWYELVEQADTLQFLSDVTVRRMFEVITGTRKDCPVYTAPEVGHDMLGRFSVGELSKAWTKLANERDMTGIEWYQSGEPDAADYAAALEISIAGEVVFG